MVTREVDLARRHEKVAVDEVDDPVGEVGREVGTVVGTAVFAESARDVDAREALAQREFHIRVSLVIAKKDVEARLALLDEIVFKRERFLVVGHDDVIDIDSLADERARFRVVKASFMEIRGDPASQILRLADVDDGSLGVLVEVHAGRGGESPDFLEEVHLRGYIQFKGKQKCSSSSRPKPAWAAAMRGGERCRAGREMRRSRLHEMARRTNTVWRG